MKNVFYLQFLKYLQNINIFYEHYWIPHTEKHEYRHQNRTPAMLEPNLCNPCDVNWVNLY